MAPIGIGSAAWIVLAMLFGQSGHQQPNPQEITVAATDYAFLALPPIRSGPIVIGFTNQGKVNHEVAIGRLNPGITVDDYVKTPPGPQRLALIDGGMGILIAAPGKTTDGKLWVNAVKGSTYVVWCNFRDKPDAPQHMVLGMYTTFTPK
ncbi:MAG TPA: hypothetical protein VF105_11365 [Gemmatimonadaceae bacterium]